MKDVTQKSGGLQIGGGQSGGIDIGQNGSGGVVIKKPQNQSGQVVVQQPTNSGSAQIGGSGAIDLPGDSQQQVSSGGVFSRSSQSVRQFFQKYGVQLP